MDKAQFEREMERGAALAIASRLLRSELITTDEHRTLTAALTEKYRPVSSQQHSAGDPTPKE